ncbi:MAG TPA: helix-turn-helix domain-containing protein [Chthoniobacteraceae bacterium]|nr:helix-turn-helix domain-containing protein [Chthoniobacteraceae bacterium]
MARTARPRKRGETNNDLDNVWKALSDPTRRSILDSLRKGPLTTTEIVTLHPDLTRFGVMKHLDVLRDAGLVLDRWVGRSRINSLNVVPIRQIYERWVSGYEDLWASKLTSLKHALEEEPKRRK